MSMNKQSRNQGGEQRSFLAGFLLDLFFGPEDGDMFLRNVGSLSTDYTALYPIR
jgi:hypothetical protein